MTRILIVDEKEENHSFFQALLSTHGYTLDHARHGAEALAKARREPPDLIVSDLLMPVMDGYTLLRHWKADARLNAIPFIVYAETCMRAEDELLAMNLGADAFILKPAEPEDLLSRLREVRVHKAATPESGPVEFNSETVVRALVERTRQLEAINRTLHKDIADQRLAQSRLEQNASILRLAGRVAHLGGWTIEMPGRVLTWSDETCAIHDAPPGYQPTLDEGLALFPPEHRAKVVRHVEACVREGISYEFDVPKYTIKGRRIWVRSIGVAIRDDDGNVIRLQGAFQDITERKQAEEALRESEERFREMADNIGEVFFSFDPVNNRLLYVNAAYERIWGRSIDDIYTKHPSYLDAVHPDHRQAVKDDYGHQLAGMETNAEFRIIRPDGGVRWVHKHAVPILDSQGRVERIVGTMRDITENKRIEQQFLRAQRLESIGTLAGGIAHDLNNVLAPILLSVELFQLDEKDPERLKMLTHIANSARHGAQLVNQVLSFARGVEGERMPVNLHHLTSDLQRILRDTFPKNIDFQIETGPDLWSLKADATQLHQVLMNLCVNARDAMAVTGGRLTLRLENIVLDEILTGMNPASKPGNHVLISVEDTGTGIPHQIRERIFDPFFTTKEFGKGTGLGLATVLGIVKSHGGFIEVSSETGHGARFSVYLPADATAGATATAPAVHTSHLTKGNGELILVVDDEESIRVITRQLLERCGYRVFLAANGVEAVSCYTRHGTEIAAVLTDMAMPLMDGPATITALRALNPEVKIIGFSGHTGNESLIEKTGTGLEYFIAKPFTAENFLKTFAQLLEKA